ncbi:MAG: hypothetical protein A4E69_03050 [Syntrophus sp. PtaB.Bin138]|nr:MAG: hypothetical protein A4E69_03050 [Syntrophus sp. PtaB.Bin138]
MEPMRFAKQMALFNKTAFDNAFHTMTLLQEQIENTMISFTEQAPWVPADGKKAIGDWIQASRKGRDDFKRVVDDNFKKVEDFFAHSAKG